VTRSSEVNTEELLSRIANCFVADDLGNHSVEWATKSIELQQSAVKPVQKPSATESTPTKGVRERRVRTPGMSDEKVFTSGRDALRAVESPLGSWNWVLLGPDPETLPITGGGSGSIDELQECLAQHEEEVLFGVLRLGFGAGRLRRTKLVFFHANGARVAAVRRGKLGAVRPKMEKAVKDLVHCSLAVEVNSTDDLSLEGLIERLRRTAIIDDDVLEGDSAAKSSLSLEAFRKALAEERRMVSTEADSPAVKCAAEAAQVPGASLTLEESIQLVHNPDGLGWVVLGASEAWSKPKQRRHSLLPGGIQPTQQASSAGA